MKNRKAIILLTVFLVLLLLTTVIYSTYNWIDSTPAVRFVTLASAEDARAIERHGDLEHIIVVTRKADWPENYERVYIETDKVRQFWSTWNWDTPTYRLLVLEKYN